MTAVLSTPETQEAPPDESDKHDVCAGCYPPKIYNHPGTWVLSICGVAYQIKETAPVQWNNYDWNCSKCATLFHPHWFSEHGEYHDR